MTLSWHGILLVLHAGSVVGNANGVDAGCFCGPVHPDWLGVTESLTVSEHGNWTTVAAHRGNGPAIATDAPHSDLVGEPPCGIPFGGIAGAAFWDPTGPGVFHAQHVGSLNYCLARRYSSLGLHEGGDILAIGTPHPSPARDGSQLVLFRQHGVQLVRRHADPWMHPSLIREWSSGPEIRYLVWSDVVVEEGVVHAAGLAVSSAPGAPAWWFVTVRNGEIHVRPGPMDQVEVSRVLVDVAQGVVITASRKSVVGRDLKTLAPLWTHELSPMVGDVDRICSGGGWVRIVTAVDDERPHCQSLLVFGTDSTTPSIGEGVPRLHGHCTASSEFSPR